MPPMSLLQCDPREFLHFSKSPAAPSPNRLLKLKNVHSGFVAFKVKTTAPKSYVVRPCSGTLRPGDTQEVQIILQPGNTDSASAHRFLVQAAVVHDSEPIERGDWAKFPRDALQEQMLNVVVDEQGSGEEKPVAGAATARGSAAGAGQGSSDLQDLQGKYNDLVPYTLSLEKENKKLDADLKSLLSARSEAAGDGFSKLTLLLAVLAAVAAAFAARSLG